MERKVKSVIRGQKGPLHSSLAQKNVSPAPKRVRNQAASIPNTLETKLQGHLFGAKVCSP